MNSAMRVTFESILHGLREEAKRILQEEFAVAERQALERAQARFRAVLDSIQFTQHEDHIRAITILQTFFEK